ncbi:MAG TPA: hypothetical protein VD860_17040 [Azospirillum sp.]|nr:hypothetical protein [Azospirillum sp.]
MSCSIIKHPVAELEDAKATIDALRDLVLEIHRKADDPAAVKALAAEAILAIDGDKAE